ncbi:hypothetical protein sce5127 [Sorangium cellulosum So ce56]|uniref:Uncharacterized protein n=1 Tax=Sorangium cellulosum (strain So ce56) TaxID=448385 RepID=A9FRG4_SORC5|nr:hypothetical protein sce5127 [Sorangium cellulosum So ce56]
MSHARPVWSRHRSAPGPGTRSRIHTRDASEQGPPATSTPVGWQGRLAGPPQPRSGWLAGPGPPQSRSGPPNLGRVRLNLGRVRLNLGRVRLNLGRVRLNLGRVRLSLGRGRLNLGRGRLNLGRVRLNLGRVRLNLGRVRLNLGRVHPARASAVAGGAAALTCAAGAPIPPHLQRTAARTGGSRRPPSPLDLSPELSDALARSIPLPPTEPWRKRS